TSDAPLGQLRRQHRNPARRMSADVRSIDVFTASRNHLTRSGAGLQKMTGRNAYAVSSDGATVQLSDGRQVLDLGTWAATLLGHRPARVVAAIKDQCDALPTAA